MESFKKINNIIANIVTGIIIATIYITIAGVVIGAAAALLMWFWALVFPFI